VPLVLARDVSKGLLLLSDLGHRQYLDELTADREVDRLYADALEALVTMQTAGDEAARSLPAYDRQLLLREMELFPEWFLGRHLGIAVGGGERRLLDRLFDALVQAALSQPAAFVHRDYHSRNLLLTAERNPGMTFKMRCGDPLPTMQSLSSRTATLRGRRNGCGRGYSGTVKGWNVPVWEWEPMPPNSCVGSI
jgi:Phosphotransferase enzyme family